MKKSKLKTLPKPRTNLHQVLGMKATSNASGKHIARKPKADRKIVRLIEYEDH